MSTYAFFNGDFVPLQEAKLSITAHALFFGTAVLEGLRAYWNEEQQQLFVFRMRDHYARMKRSARIVGVGLPYSEAELCEITLELLRRNSFRQTVHFRPLAYKDRVVDGDITLNLDNVSDGFLIVAHPMGPLLGTATLRCCVSSWRRNDDNAMPPRAKVSGGYLQSCLAHTEARQKGFDEAVILNQDGHVSEGPGENIFLVMGGRLVTPSEADNLLVGVTRDTIIRLAQEELGLGVVERQVDRTELYACDECFMCGSGAEIAPVSEVDGRPVGDGGIGPVTAQLQRHYGDTVYGRKPRHLDWLTPVYTR